MELIIDAGHGGHDPGACGFGHQEKDITLAWAKLLQTAFEADVMDRGFTTMTRNDDVFVSLADRCFIANGHDPKADSSPDWRRAFISLHCNSSDGDPGRGMEVFHYPGSVEGLRLATLIDKHWPHFYKRGVKEAEFYVLKNTRMPAVLIEVGFINNPEEVPFITGLQWAFNAVSGIIEAINEWR